MAVRTERKRLRFAVLAALAMAALLAVGGCGSRGGTGPGDKGKAGHAGAEQVQTARVDDVRYPLAVKDDLGRDVTVEKLPERIVSLAPSNTEILFALGLGDRVVGVTTFCDYPAEAKEKEKVGGFQDLNIEKVVALQPDLVLATGGIQQAAVDQLAKLGVSVYVLNPRTVDEVIGGIRTVGRLAGVPERGERVAADLDRRVDAVRDRTETLPEDRRPGVFFEVWPDPLTTAGPGSFPDDMIRLAGGRNVAGDAGEPYPQFSLETLVERDPAVIVTPFAQTAEELANGKRSRAWQGLRAARDGRVAVVDQDLTSRPGPRLVDGLEAFARAIHPELFGGGR